jgi:hypothetical protein
MLACRRNNVSVKNEMNFAMYWGNGISVKRFFTAEGAEIAEKSQSILKTQRPPLGAARQGKCARSAANIPHKPVFVIAYHCQQAKRTNENILRKGFKTPNPHCALWRFFNTKDPNRFLKLCVPLTWRRP